jgi:hypothetical protein
MKMRLMGVMMCPVRVRVEGIRRGRSKLGLGLGVYS